MILLLVPMIMVACGDDDDNGSIELSQSFSEARLSFNYPDGWVASGEVVGAVVATVANSEDALTTVQETIFTDESIPEGAAAIVFLLRLTGGATLEEVEARLAENEDSLEFERETIAGQDAGVASTEEGNNRLDQYVLVYGDIALVVTAAARADEFDDFEETFSAIVNSISYEVPAAEDGGETGNELEDGGETED